MGRNEGEEKAGDGDVHTFRLGDTSYVESGVFSSGDVTSAPGLQWARVKVDELTDEG